MPNFAPKWNFYGCGSQAKIPLVSSIQMTHLLSDGHEDLLIYAVDQSQGERQVSEIHIVCEFPDVFPEEIPGFPPEREVEFSHIVRGRILLEELSNSYLEESNEGCSSSVRAVTSKQKSENIRTWKKLLTGVL